MHVSSMKQDIYSTTNDSDSIADFSFVPNPVFKILDDAVEKYAERPAINFEDINFSYKEFGLLVNKVATGLQALGVSKGIKVGIYMPNTHYSIAFYYGILKAGGTVVNYNPLYAIRELTFQVENSETDILIIIDNEDILSKSEQILNSTDLKKLVICPTKSTPLDIVFDEQHISFDNVIDNDGVYESVSIDPLEDIAVLQYTGGTTGVPKAAMLTHSNVFANVEQFYTLLENVIVDGEEKTLGILPLFHVFAMTVVMNYSFRCGAEILLVSHFDPKIIAPILREKKPTIIPGVPTIFGVIASHPLTKDIDLSYTKYCVAGGAPIPRETKELFEKNTGAKVVEAYGLTEASPVTNSNPPVGVNKTNSIGPVIPGTTIEVINLKDGVSAVATGETGEICFKGPQVMKGYYKTTEETDKVLRNGRLHTGDIGYIDEDGYVFLLDRLKDMILINGYNVYPTQVEAQIHKHADIEECLVVGVPDEKRGETVWAWVKTIDGSTLTDVELKAFLKDKLSLTEIPRRIIFRDEPLPKTAVGKLSRKLLLEQEGIK